MLAQINFSFGPSSFLALLNLGLSVFYLATSMAQLIKVVKANDDVLVLIIKILQLLLVPLCLFFTARILFFSGWRLDPELFFSFFLMQVVTTYLVVCEIVRQRWKELKSR